MGLGWVGLGLESPSGTYNKSIARNLAPVSEYGSLDTSASTERKGNLVYHDNLSYMMRQLVSQASS